MAVVPNEPQNSAFSGLNDFFNTFTNVGEKAANVYSTFMSAKTTAQLAKMQQTQSAYKPTQSEIDAIGSALGGVGATRLLLIAAAVGVTGLLIYKGLK